MVFRYEHGLGVVREVSVSWNWRLSIVFGKHWSVFGCGLGGVYQREVILKCFLFSFFYSFFWMHFSLRFFKDFLNNLVSHFLEQSKWSFVTIWERCVYGLTSAGLLLCCLRNNELISEVIFLNTFPKISNNVLKKYFFEILKISELGNLENLYFCLFFFIWRFF